ncbi:hypothetical protein HO133_001559 [Letharia lupina]|uniref:Uncharacterized protein n=1 Tax=Letharia lupina TaxID=560253 RepID=A0A8H6CDL2_9LECA|nr:uncharacterized protein HO133_001559 [Letharia lupina]KAF6221593.1 hypothetical protein HO133_001559 [Letharia lupina]
MALWWDKTLNLTLDTISVLITQYNNTAVTRTTTIYEDVSSINISTLSDAQATAFSVLEPLDPEYEANGFALNNGTNAFVDGSFTAAYPTPYIGIQGFEYISVTQQDPQCPKGLQSAGQYFDTQGECACVMQTYMENPNQLQYAITSQITLSSTYYELGDPHPVGNDLNTHLEGPVPINNISYSDFIASVLGSEGFNKYRSCAFLDVGVGPPALMIPVAALTATTTSTVKSAGNYGVSSPSPGSPIAPIAPPQTSTPVAQPSVPLVEPTSDKKPQPESSTAQYVAPQTAAPAASPKVPIVNSPKLVEEQPSPPSPANSPVNEPAKAGPQGPVESPYDSSGTDQTGSNEGQPAVGPSDSSTNGQSNTGAQPAAGPTSDSNDSGGSDTGDTRPVPVVAVAISYAGSSITPDTSSYYSIPQIGKLSPGGSPVTTKKIVYSLAPSATALVSNGQTISLPTFAAAEPDTIKQAIAPALTFAGSTYTADSSSIIVVAGQSIVPGAPAITVSSTPISLAHGALVAVVGGTTQSLYHAVPTAYPEIKFAGETYTANADSVIYIQGQTLIPGSPAISIASTPISLAPGASVAVIAGQTQSLSAAGPTAGSAITFAGSTYTANAASAFVIEGQTLFSGSVITVSSTPISLATGGSFAVVAGLTQPLAVAPAPTGPPIFTFHGSTYTAGTGSDFLIGSQTLTEGGVVTVAGTPISYASNGRDVVVGTSTEAVKIGGLIMSGFGNGGASTTGPIQFTGGAMRCKGGLSLWSICTLFGGMVLLGLP